MNILLLEDSSAFRRLLKLTLQEEGHTITDSQDGAIAYDRDVITSTDVMITDIDMPRVNGIEAINAAQRINPTLIAIAMSGGGTHDSEDYLNACRDLGATEILEKPFEPDVLIEMVRALKAA